MNASIESLERLLGASFAGVQRPHPLARELPLAAPDSLDGMVEVVQLAARDGLVVVPCGLGSKLGWCRPPERADLVLSTRRYAGVVSHVPDDGTLAARAGTPLAELRARVRAGGHWLVPDVPRAERATLGGVLAAGQSGPDRTRYGPVRNHVLGMQVLLADGSLAKSGGQLVKNVTGYDLHRLYTGSHGTLCVILEAALRLFPAPDHEVWIELESGDEREALAHARRAAQLPLRWLSLSLLHLDAAGPWRVAAHLAGKREPVAWERDELLPALPGARAIEGAAAAQRAAAERDARPAGGAEPFVHVACRPSRLEGALGLALAALARAGEPVRLSAEPATAEFDLALAPERAGAIARTLRSELEPLGATVFLRNAPADALDLDPLGADAAGLALMRRLKTALDPRGVFAAGRFHAGL